MRSIDKYCCNSNFGYSVNKTYVYEIKPVGKTADYMLQRGLIENDKIRLDKAELVKGYIDRLHRTFIDRVLTEHSSELDVSELAKLYGLLLSDNDKSKIKKEIKVHEARIRKQISEWFLKDKEYKSLFGKTLFEELLPSSVSEEEKNNVEYFKGFLQYFASYNQVRQYIYGDEEKHNTIPYRIINENFRIYYENLVKLQENVTDVSVLKSFPVTDEQIARYNLVIGGDSKEIKGYNQIVNEKKLGFPYLSQLYKNILTETKPLFSVESFKSTREVVEACRSLFEAASELDDEFRKIGCGGNDELIFVHRKNLSKFSLIVSGEPLLVRKVLENENIIVTDYISLASIKNAFINQKKAGYFESSELYADKYFAMESRYFRWKSCAASLELSKIDNLQTDKTQVLPLKSVLEQMLDLFHQIKIVFLDEDFSGNYDVEFYNSVNKVYSVLEPVISVYNKTRNFVTKKLSQQKKLSLNFESSTLLSGWDLNKENTSNSVIFFDEKEERYYLGIMNVGDRPVFTAKPGSGFKKMCYKYLPQPNKMIPHVVFSKKGLEAFCPSEEILEGYKKGLHLKGDAFDLNFCHKLIDFFKKCIYEYENWKVFNFKFSETSNYKDLSDFYGEINQQGYNIQLADIDREKLFASVEEGKLYLFEITNRFMSGKAHSKHIPTEVFKAIFKKDSSVQLNGGAEIFYRPAVTEPRVTHKQGSYLVNKYTSTGLAVSDDDYKSIYNHLNFGKQLSAEAKALLDTGSIVYKKADFNIIKDKRYSTDKFEFHVPCTINYKYKSGCNVRNFNSSVLNEFRTNPDVNILSVTRGENNLVYAVLQNQEGKVLLERSFNIIGEKVKVNYKNKLSKIELRRDEERRNWQNIERIKDLKEGFMGNVLHEIVNLMIDNNAVLVTEDLSGAFKDSRMKIESNVYKMFESALINKLSCLMFKNADDAGSINKPYQLTPPADGFGRAGSQYGWVFFINPAYISKIIPGSTFINNFGLNRVNTFEQKKSFLKMFYSIEFTGEEINLYYTNATFSPKFKGNNVVKLTGSRTLWDREAKKYVNHNIKDYISDAMCSLGIVEKGDIKPVIEKLQFNIRNNKGLELLIQAVKIVCEMKTFSGNNYYFKSPSLIGNSYDGKDVDFIACLNLADKFKFAINNAPEEGFIKQPKTEDVLNANL